ncbi:hypothetical protein OROGR_011997 [Orobanche gracilis]
MAPLKVYLAPPLLSAKIKYGWFEKLAEFWYVDQGVIAPETLDHVPFEKLYSDERRNGGCLCPC